MKKRRNIVPYFRRQITEGNKLLVMGSGLASLEVPFDWLSRSDPAGMVLFDRKQPDNECILEVSMLRMTPRQERMVPSWILLQDVLKRKGYPIPREEIHEQSRPGLDIAWAQFSELREHENRVANYRQSVVCAADFSLVITFAFWPEASERLAPVWAHALDTMEIGQQVENGLPIPTPN